VVAGRRRIGALKEALHGDSRRESKKVLSPPGDCLSGERFRKNLQHSSLWAFRSNLVLWIGFAKSVPRAVRLRPLGSLASSTVSSAQHVMADTTLSIALLW
jgi:hypothetical protein